MAKPSAVQPKVSCAAVGAAGIAKPRICEPGSSGSGGTDGVGVRPSAPASPNVGGLTASSAAAALAKATGAEPRTRPGTPQLRCRWPNAASTSNAPVLASTSAPYDVVSRASTEPSRTAALTTPETATAVKHQRARVEKRGTA